MNIFPREEEGDIIYNSTLSVIIGLHLNASYDHWFTYTPTLPMIIGRSSSPILEIASASNSTLPLKFARKCKPYGKWIN